MKAKRPFRVRVQDFVGWCRDVRSVRECKSILRANLDRDYDKDDSLRGLTVVTVNALYWARHQPPNVKAEGETHWYECAKCGKPADPATDKYWCAWCGVWGDHQSGWCKDLKAKLGDTPNVRLESRRAEQGEP